MRNIDVITSGYVSMDHIIKIATPVEIGFTSLVTNKTNSKIYYGGCSVNIAYALCKLGKQALPILRVGKDYEENGFKHFLEEGNVPFEGIRVLEEETTSTCYLLQDNNNNHITIFYPGAMDGKYAGELDDELFNNTRLGVITVAPREDNREFLRKCKEHRIPIVFGMKDDFNAFPTEFLKEILTESKIIFTNEVEREIIEKLYGFQEITELFEIGQVDTIITTLGKEGSICYQRSKNGIQKELITICPVQEVIDATGSGDAYMAGFLYGYLEGLESKECCRMGSVLSYFVLQSEGCCTNIPTKEEFLKKYNHMKER